MTERKTPCLIPVRVNACVFDPQTLSRTKNIIKESGAVHASPHPWAWHAPNYDRLDSRRTEAFERIWPQLFESIAPPQMEAGGGVCLTITPAVGFSTPMDNDESRQLPSLPDRWLWVRILRRVHDAQGKWRKDEAPKVRAWIIDTGVASENVECAPILTGGNDRITAVQVGVKRSLKEAQKHGPEEPRVMLHAQGADECASITFTAYAPANMNNTSCIDSLDDVPLDELKCCVLSYFVVGWYRDPSRHDPIVKQKLAGKTDDEIRQQLGLDGEVAAGGRPLGDRSIFHGLVTHIDYWNERSYLGPAFGSPLSEPAHPCVGTFQHEPQQIGFGATTEEALAALLAKVDPGDMAEQKLSADFFRLLNTLLQDRVDTWDTVGEDDVLRHANRNATFHSLAAGSEWTIGSAEDIGTTTSQRRNLDVTADQRSMLQALNGLQNETDVARGEYASTVETLYTAWWQTLRARGRRKLVVERRTNEQMEHAELLRKDIERLRIAIDSARNTLQASLDATLGKGTADVKQFPTNSFHLPKEPAIAIRNVGPKVPPYPDTTIARTLDETATDRAVGNYGRLSRAPIRAAINDYADADLRAILDALADEASLVEEAIASLMRDSERTAPFDSNSNVAQWEDRNRRVRAQERAIELFTVNGGRIPLSNLGSAWCRQPWIPLFLDWEVEWFPSSEGTESGNGTLLSGRTILASRPQHLIHSRLESMERMGPKAATMIANCRHLLNDAIECDALAQSLSGLHQQLLLRDDLLPRVLPTEERLRSLVEHTSLAPPNLAPNLAFDSLRRGSARVCRLWVVDSFGQAFSLDPDIKTATKPLGNRQLIPLETRLLEPSRLSVEFEYASNDGNPVRGWILSSLADNALIIYDARGNPLGVVFRTAISSESAGATWRPASANAPKTVFDVADPVLGAFLQPLVGGSDALLRLNATMRVIDEALARTLPPQSSTTSPASMQGRPLVLLQARVGIKRRGGPIVEPTALMNASSDATDNAAMNVPFWIGARNLPDDGVIAFRCGNTAAPIERTAKLEMGPPAGPPSFTLNTSRASESTSLTLLMDPRGKIYLESEILPLTTIHLPPEWIDDVAQKLPAVLRAAPVLIHSAALLRSILLPRDDLAPASIDLPLPVGSGNGVRNDVQAILSTGHGIDVPVKPLSTLGVIPERQIAAIEGLLIL